MQFLVQFILECLGSMKINTLNYFQNFSQGKTHGVKLPLQIAQLINWGKEKNRRYRFYFNQMDSQFIKPWKVFEEDW